MKNLFLVGMLLFAYPIRGHSQASEASDEKKMFDEGKAFFKDGRFDEAAQRFRRAYQLRPSYKILYNIGHSEAAAKRYGVALEAFEKYLAEGGDDIDIDRQSGVRSEILRLREMTGFIEVKAAPGVVVYVDDLKRGEYPTTQRIPVAGTVVHHFKAEDGGRVMTRDVRVSGGDTVTVEVVFDTPTVETDEAVAPEEKGTEKVIDTKETDRWKRWRLIGLVVSGAGVGALVAGSICGGLYLNAENLLENKCDGLACSEDERDLIDKRDGLGVASTALWITGGVMTAGGVALVLVSMMKSKEEARSAVSLYPGPNGLTLMGRF